MLHYRVWMPNFKWTAPWFAARSNANYCDHSELWQGEKKHWQIWNSSAWVIFDKILVTIALLVMCHLKSAHLCRGRESHKSTVTQTVNHSGWQLRRLYRLLVQSSFGWLSWSSQWTAVVLSSTTLPSGSINLPSQNSLIIFYHDRLLNYVQRMFSIFKEKEKNQGKVSSELSQPSLHATCQPSVVKISHCHHSFVTWEGFWFGFIWNSLLYTMERKIPSNRLSHHLLCSPGQLSAHPLPSSLPPTLSLPSELIHWSLFVSSEQLHTCIPLCSEVIN